MNNVLSKILESRGIKDITELDDEEREQFENWQKTLSKEELTVKDIRKFCEHQLATIALGLRDMDIDSRKQDKLVAQQTVYSVLLDAIGAPQSERAQLEKYLTSLV